MSDPMLLTKAHGTCLIIGKSASGKTTLIKSILKKSIRPTTNVYTLNVKSSEYAKISDQVFNIDFEQLNTVPKHSIVIIEDVISLTPFQAKTLREAINFNAHHKKQKIFVVTHHVYKTNIYQLIPYFNYVVFTSSISNLPILKLILQYSQIDKQTLEEWAAFFTKKTKPFAYFIFDSEQQSFYRADTLADLRKRNFKSIDGISNQSKPSKDDLIIRFDSFVNNDIHKQSASTIFSILINALASLENINPIDLSLQCQSDNKTISISLVDYVMSLLDKSTKLTKFNVFLHKYFLKRCKIPMMFIKNKRYHSIKIAH